MARWKPELSLAYLKSFCDVRMTEGHALSTPCWLWKKRRTATGGYAEINWDGHTRRVHQLTYAFAKGPMSAGKVPDHLCRVRHCVNPEHLEPVTTRENLLRSPITIAGQHARKTHCKSGHAFDEANTIIINAERGWRACRACRRAKGKRWNAKRKLRTQQRRGT